VHATAVAAGVRVSRAWHASCNTLFEVTVLWPR